MLFMGVFREALLLQKGLKRGLKVNQLKGFKTKINYI